MLFNKYVFIAACIILLPLTTVQPLSLSDINQKRGLYLLGAGISLVALTKLQHRSSYVAVERYPLIQRQHAITTQLIKEQKAKAPSKEVIAQLNDEFNAISLALNNIKNEQNIRNIGRMIALIATGATITGAYCAKTEESSR